MSTNSNDSQKSIKAGDPIPLDDAKKYVKEHIRLKDILKQKILDKITESQKKDSEVIEAAKHFHSEANAFIFKRELIERFLKDVNKPDYIGVFFGAKFKNDDPFKSDPTVVVAGLNDKQGSPFGDLVSMSIEDPANEQPPYKVDFEFPDPQDPQIFTVKILS